MANNSPALATLMDSDAVRSLSVPPTTITPQPIMKLPASSAHEVARMLSRLRVRSASTMRQR